MLSLESASYRHAGTAVDALRDIDLELADGALTGLVGASGAGLSTLILVLGGLAPRVVGGRLHGTLRVDGEDVSAWPMHRLAQHVASGLGRPAAQLSMVAETVFEEVAFGPANLGLTREEIVARTWRSLEALGVASLAVRDPRQLSGGEQQLVVLASLLAMGSRHLVLDSPLTQLDPRTRAQVLDALAGSAMEGAAVLVAEHRADALADRCRAMLRLAHGRLVDASVPALDAAASAEPARNAPASSGRSDAAPDIVLERVSHTYPSGVRGLDGVDLSICAGESVAIVGANGSGKTTLVRHLDGLLRPTRGRVLIGGEDAARRSVASLARSVAVGFQDPDDQIFARSVAAEVAFGARQLGRERAAVARSVEQALDAVGLENHGDTHPADLGTSQRKLLTIASLLAMERPVLVLDEPTAGLDDAGVQLVERVVAAQRALGHSVIVVSHDEPFVAGSFVRVVRMERGRIVADEAPEATATPC